MSTKWGLLMTTPTKEIKDAVEKKKIIIGTHQSIKHAKRGQVKTIIHASNIPPSILKELNHYARISKIELKPFGRDAIRLGQVCGRPFKILSVAIRRDDSSKRLKKAVT